MNIIPTMQAVDNETGLKMIKEAYANGEITLKRSNTYRSQKPEPGHIFYQIKFIQGEKKKRVSVYNGAYQMDKVFEMMLTPDKITTFLLHKLLTQLQ